MSALLRPPQPPAHRGRGYNYSHRGGRGRGRDQEVQDPGHGGRGRGRGIAHQGRGRSYPHQHQPVQPRRTGGELINVGVLIRYADQSINQGRYRWPPSITERQALGTILSSQRDQDLADIIEVTLNQVPRVGVARIPWLDVQPYGHYYFNQHIYGEGGLQQQLKAELRDRDLVYNPDLDNVQFQGSLDNYYDARLEDRRPAQPVGPGPRYDPTIF